MSAVKQATEVLRAIPMPVWLGVAAAVGVWLAWRKMQAPLASVGEAISDVAEAVAGVANDAVAVVANSAIVTDARNNDTLRGAVDSRYGAGVVLTPKTKPKAKVHYGYDVAKSRVDAIKAAQSQIAKDVKKYGGGYGALTK